MAAINKGKKGQAGENAKTIKKKNKKTHPRFKRPNVGRTKRTRLKDTWRRPRGKGNKQRKKLKKAGKLPSIGYGGQYKHIHPLGKEEVVVHNVDQLRKYKEDNVILRIASTVGARKKIKMLKIADELGLYVLNPGVSTRLKRT